MRAFLISIIILVTGHSALTAQETTDRIVAEIEKNNTGLSSLRISRDAQKLGNKTGIYLKNPEIGFSYLWGSPAMIGKRTDLSFEQTFDFPTAYRYKSQIAAGRDQQAELDYERQRLGLIAQVRMLCIDLTHTLAMENEFKKRLGHAQNMVKSYQAKFDLGDAGILEINRARIYLLGIQNEFEVNRIEYESLLAELAELNGGIPVQWTDSTYPSRIIPNDFEQWYQGVEELNPVLLMLRKELEINRQTERLKQAMGLPGFSAGYLSEKIVGEHFQGITLGMSLPLWENKNEIRHAKAQSLAIQEAGRDRKLVFYNRMKMLHSKSVRLKASVDDYRTALKDADNGLYLVMALDAGEISLTDYLFELTMYYESQTSLIHAEWDLNRAISALYQFVEF